MLAHEVVSIVDVPPADNSAMDGYAMRRADVPAAGTVLPWPARGRRPGGRPPSARHGRPHLHRRPGAEGADAVVMQEQCDALDGAVRVNISAGGGLAIRRRGEDVRLGSVVLPAGARLTPQALGLAASVGAATLHVVRRPKVALFSTGDELAMPGEAAQAAAPSTTRTVSRCAR